MTAAERMAHHAYLLVGEEFLAAEALDRVRAEVSSEPLSEISFDATDDVHEIVTTLETPSLLGGRRLVVVRDAHRLGKGQAAVLERYLASPAPGSVLVLVGAGPGPLAAAVSRTGAVLALQPPRGRALVAWLRDRARARNMKLDDRAAWALMDAVGSELRELDGALEQLSTGRDSGAPVTPEEVRRMFGGLAEEHIWALTDAFGDRKPAEAMITLRRLLRQGDEPLVVLGALAAHVRRLLVAKKHDDGGPAAVGAALGLQSWRARRVHRQARGFRDDELIRALEVLSEADLDLKSGELPGTEGAEMALERALVKILVSG